MKPLVQMWKQSKSLTTVTILMLPIFLLSAVGIFLDTRMITGVPAWLKPAKFALSIAIYAGTLAWIFQFITVRRRLAKWLGELTAIALFVEIVIIALQAARGTTSHFNQSTPLDGALFGIMGISILLLWLASVGVCYVLFRQLFADRAWGWSLRWGMLITVIGSAAGGIMVHYGAHTVGAADGGAGLLGIGWSRTHGDLRIPHFFGLHGLQVIPLLYWFLIRKRRSAQTALVTVTAASYFTFVSLLAIQALRGQSVILPDGPTLAGWGAWLLFTVTAWRTIDFNGRTKIMQNVVRVF